MLDLNTMIERFLDEAINTQIDQCSQLDNMAIRSVNNILSKNENRHYNIAFWLKRYRALRSYKREWHSAIVSEIVKFADKGREPLSIHNLDVLLQEYSYLYSRIQNVVPSKQDDKPRDVAVITSKALWICYPNDVPMLDSYAERALSVISRLVAFNRLEGRSDGTARFEQFAHTWCRLYDIAQFDSVSIGDYPYRVRVFDRILRIIGEPGYGLVPYQPLAAETRLHGARAA